MWHVAILQRKKTGHSLDPMDSCSLIVSNGYSFVHERGMDNFKVAVFAFQFNTSFFFAGQS